jgi:hypothetical protein
MTTQHLATEIGNPNQLFMQGNQPFGQPMGQPYMQPSIAQPGAYGQPMPYGQPMAYDQPLYPPIAPNGMVNGPPGMYNPNPVIM